MNKPWILMMIAGIGFLGAARPAAAEVFKSAKECVPGTRVTDNSGKSGKIIGIDRDSAAMCDVLIDSTGKVGYYIFWMLHAEGVSAETNDKLVSGTYQCFAGNPNQYTFMNLGITGSNTYEWAGGRGQFRVEPSRKIVFESGPLAKYTSKLLAGPSIGLNTDGGTFYGTHCDLKKR